MRFVRSGWVVVAVAVAAGGGFAAGRLSDGPAGPSPAADLAFARLLDESDTAADPVVTIPVDPAVRAYTTRLLGLAGSAGSDPRTIRLVRAAAAGAQLGALDDADRDGLDDDGLVQVGAACVLLPISASYQVTVQAGACADAAAPPLDGDVAYGPKRFPESYLRTL